MIEEVVGNTCSMCNQSFPSVCLDFHHRDPTEKDFSVSQLLNHRWETILDEINKCDLLCACCHRLEHQNIRNEETNR